MSDLELKPGMVLRASDDGKEYVFIGFRNTKAGTVELVFARVVQLHWPHALRTYMATRRETLVRKFPELKWYSWQEETGRDQ